MGILRGVLKFRNPDSSADLNRRLIGVVGKGVYDGDSQTAPLYGNIKSRVLGVAGVNQIQILPFLAMSADGMFVEHSGTPTILGVNAGPQTVFLRAKYVVGGEPVISLEVKSDVDFASDPDHYGTYLGQPTDYLIILAKITPTGPSGSVLPSDIDLRQNPIVNSIGHNFIRGVVADLAALNALVPGVGESKDLVDGDVYLSLADRQFYRYTEADGWLTITDGAVAAELTAHKTTDNPAHNASVIEFNAPYGEIVGTRVNAALQNLENNKVKKSGDTMSGKLTIDMATSGLSVVSSLGPTATFSTTSGSAASFTSDTGDAAIFNSGSTGLGTGVSFTGGASLSGSVRGGGAIYVTGGSAGTAVGLTGPGGHGITTTGGSGNFSDTATGAGTGLVAAGGRTASYGGIGVTGTGGQPYSSGTGGIGGNFTGGRGIGGSNVGGTGVLGTAGQGVSTHGDGVIGLGYLASAPSPASVNNSGVVGVAGTNGTAGVVGTHTSSAGTGVQGSSVSGKGVEGSGYIGVKGNTTSGGASRGVWGNSAPGSFGDTYGVFGTVTGAVNTGFAYGVHGDVTGLSGSVHGIGVYGKAASTGIGTKGQGFIGVYGVSSSTDPTSSGVKAEGHIGDQGSLGVGVSGTGGTGGTGSYGLSVIGGTGGSGGLGSLPNGDGGDGGIGGTAIVAVGGAGGAGGYGSGSGSAGSAGALGAAINATGEIFWVDGGRLQALSDSSGDAAFVDGSTNYPLWFPSNDGYLALGGISRTLGTSETGSDFNIKAGLYRVSYNVSYQVTSGSGSPYAVFFLSTSSDWSNRIIQSVTSSLPYTSAARDKLSASFIWNVTSDTTVRLYGSCNVSGAIQFIGGIGIRSYAMITFERIPVSAPTPLIIVP